MVDDSSHDGQRHKRLLLAMEGVKKNPLKFAKGFTADKVRNLNRKIT